MALSKLRRAIGTVKDSTSIALSKVSNGSSSDIDIVIVKATRHDDFPAEERHVREILSLTNYRRSNIGACVETIGRRLGRTKSWTVAIKALVLVQRVLADADPAFEREIFYAARNGKRLLNLSEFRDTSASNSWDFSAFVRTYALYLDEKLQHKMQDRQGQRVGFGGDDEEGESASQVSRRGTPLRERKIEKILLDVQQLQRLLDRFLACRPTGEAKNNRLVFFTLYPIVKESFQVYGEMTTLTGELIDRFPVLDVIDCTKVYDVFCQAKKQLDDLESFYGWCKHAGIARASEYPEVEVITEKKLDLMDELIRDKKAAAQRESARSLEQKDEEKEPTDSGDAAEQDMSSIKALPPPQTELDETVVDGTKGDQDVKKEDPVPQPDLIDLGFDHVHQGENLSLVLFGEATPGGPPMSSAWEQFSENGNTTDWESALVLSTSNLSNQKTTMGGGFDSLVLSSMYQHGTMSAINMNTNFMGSASSVAHGADGRSLAILALPAPPMSDTRMPNNFADPFTPSFTVAPPTFVQISDLERKQQLLMEEQLMWQQYARHGTTPGQLGQAQWQPNHYAMGGYVYQRSL